MTITITQIVGNIIYYTVVIDGMKISAMARVGEPIKLDYLRN